MFRRAITEMTDSWVWELGNQAQNRIPDPIDYIEMRRKTFGSDLTMSLSRLAHQGSVPADVYRLRPVVAMENAAADYACLLNDVFSYQKEIQFEGEIHNAVLVVQNFLDCDAAEAMRVVGELMTARMRQFQHIVGTELPALFDTLHLGTAARDAIDGHARNLQDWMSGILNWHEGCHRYGEADLARNARSAHPAHPAQPARPDRSGWLTGIGTSAARIGHTPAARLPPDSASWLAVAGTGRSPVRLTAFGLISTDVAVTIEPSEWPLGKLSPVPWRSGAAACPPDAAKARRTCPCSGAGARSPAARSSGRMNRPGPRTCWAWRTRTGRRCMRVTMRSVRPCTAR